MRTAALIHLPSTAFRRRIRRHAEPCWRSAVSCTDRRGSAPWASRAPSWGEAVPACRAGQAVKMPESVVIAVSSEPLRMSKDSRALSSNATESSVTLPSRSAACWDDDLLLEHIIITVNIQRQPQHLNQMELTLISAVSSLDSCVSRFASTLRAVTTAHVTMDSLYRRIKRRADKMLLDHDVTHSTHVNINVLTLGSQRIVSALTDLCLTLMRRAVEI